MKLISDDLLYLFGKRRFVYEGTERIVVGGFVVL